MECQSMERWETAPAEYSALICIVPLIGSSGSLVNPHRREVCPLSRQVMLPASQAQPVSVPLQDGVRFFPPLYPHRCRSASRLSSLSDRKSTRLNSSH